MRQSVSVIQRLLAVSALGWAITACGGTDDAANRMAGTAASAHAIANATITLRDSGGATYSTTSDGNGNFSFDARAMRPPLMVKAVADSGNVYAVVGPDETHRHINVTPFSHAIAGMALGAADDAALDRAFVSGAFHTVSGDTLNRAQGGLRYMLRDELGTVAGVSDDATNIRFVEFRPASDAQAGDAIDHLMQLVKPAVQGDHFLGLNVLPQDIRSVSVTSYDGVSDDLLTGGLGAAGLAGAAPAFANPANPSAAELRRNAIYANYRAVLDISANSGYGSLYGPNVDKNGVVTPIGPGVGLVAGKEYIAYLDEGNGQRNVTLMVQIPSAFNPAQACIITGASSGSRGIYGAIGSSGEWGLKHGCAVAYTDKGTGTGLYTFDTDQVNLRNGVRSARTAAGDNAIFSPPLNDAERGAYSSSFPSRIAFKHAHSRSNPERDWGSDTLAAVRFAFYALNQEYGRPVNGHAELQRTITPAHTIVIASSISNGAGAALLAAEQDHLGLIQCVAASEPQIQSAAGSGFTVEQGGHAVASQARALYDYSSFAALYEPCIAATAINTTPANRCNSLLAKGLLSGSPATDAASLAALQADARSRMHAYGWNDDSDALLNSPALTAGAAANLGNAIYVGWSNLMVTAAYAYTYGRFSVTDHVCGFSFASVDPTGTTGAPVPFGAAEAASFATQNGIPGALVYENSVGGARVFALGVSPSSGMQDQSLDGFLCLRTLATGTDPVTGVAATGLLAEQSMRVRAGVREVQASGNLHGKPAVIVQGRTDTLLPVNHASRAYLALNAQVEGNHSQLRYIEVTNANHFDAMANAMPAAIVPLHIYLFRALDAVYAHLRDGAELPPSQVVRTSTRASNTTPITTAANVPLIATSPAAGDTISVTSSHVNIPN